MATVFLRALEQAIGEVAKAKRIEGARVDHKVNTRGELVIALILPMAYAHHADEANPYRSRGHR